ncbi:hypothetical protein KSP40_PGU003907 [Platanthera guangdongensis]|uniref:Uncharacterized protein n=1 Tax=Platanthera guangdongensis TaxID=2320717 RepID=A0ABR2LWH7_9ASPA
MAILVASSLLFPPSPFAVPCRKPFPPPAIQSADGKLHHLLYRSPPLTINQHGSSSAPTTTRRLSHYAHLASKLVLSGRLNEFLTIAESILTSDVITAAESASFMSRIEAKFFSEGISAVISDGGLVDVLDFLGSADKLGIKPLPLLVGSAITAFEAESIRLMHQGRLEEFARLMEILAGKLNQLSFNSYRLFHY